VIVVDASAVIAVIAREDDSPVYAAALSTAEVAVMSPVNAAEAGMVLIARGWFTEAQELDRWLSEAGVSVLRDGVDYGDVLRVFQRYGKGKHPARLNLGDCFAYALAKQLDAPLLYKGDDFAQTDIRSALQPT
jgi:ribonuclease VapC